jgi:hypothetical protein
MPYDKSHMIRRRFDSALHGRGVRRVSAKSRSDIFGLTDQHFGPALKGNKRVPFIPLYLDATVLKPK